MLMCGLNLSAVSLATYQRADQRLPPCRDPDEQRTTAFGRLTCCFWNKNWRLRLLRSIVSRSSTSIAPPSAPPKPVMTGRPGRVSCQSRRAVVEEKRTHVLNQLAADSAGSVGAQDGQQEDALSGPGERGTDPTTSTREFWTLLKSSSPRMALLEWYRVEVVEDMMWSLEEKRRRNLFVS